MTSKSKDKQPDTSPDSQTEQTETIDFQLDEEFKHLLPPLPQDSIEKLKASIKKDGCRDPLVVWKEEKLLIDGYHRYDICEDNDISYSIIEKSFKTREEVVAWIFANQQHRRNMNKFLWAEAILKLKPSIEAEAKKHMKGGGGKAGSKISYDPAERVKTYEKLGKMAGMSEPTMRQVEFVLNNAPDETLDKLRKGDRKLSINGAFNELQEKDKPPKPPKTSALLI